jgi:hypothetical protein
VGDGLTRTNLGNNRVEIEVGDSDITTPLLADDSVSSAKIADGEVKSSDIGSGQVTTVEIANNSILLEDLDSDVASCAQENLLRYSTASPAGWKCGGSLLFTAGDGLQVDASDTLKIDAAALAGVGIEAVNDDLALQFAGGGSADSAARGNHTHPYTMTVGGSAGVTSMDAATQNSFYFSPPATTTEIGSNYNFATPHSCLVTVAGQIFFNPPFFQVVSEENAFLKTGKDGVGDPADEMAFGAFQANDGPSNDPDPPIPAYPAVAASHVWTGVTGSGDFGCFVRFPSNNTLSNDTDLRCRVSFTCVPE